MAGRWNVSLLMIKVSTVLDTNKQGFWIISTETGNLPGPWRLCNLWVFSSHQCIVSTSKASDRFLFRGWVLFLQPKEAQKVTSQPYRVEACIITKDLILGTALGPRFFYSTSFRIQYVQYSTKDRIWQPLKSFHGRVQASVEGSGWEVPVTNDQAMTLRVNDGKEGHSNGEFTCRELVANMDTTEEPRQTVGCLLTSSLMTNFQSLPPLAQKRISDLWETAVVVSFPLLRHRQVCNAILTNVSREGFCWQRCLGRCSPLLKAYMRQTHSYPLLSLLIIIWRWFLGVGNRFVTLRWACLRE